METQSDIDDRHKVGQTDEQRQMREREGNRELERGSEKERDYKSA